MLTALESEKSMQALVEQNRRLVEAQSTPLLMLDTSNLNDQGKPAIGFTLSNVGTGPAQIAWFHLTDDQGKNYADGTLYDQVQKMDPHASFMSQRITGSFLRSGDKRNVFEWPKPADGSPALETWQRLNSTRLKLHGRACYCSMFNECRVTEFGEKQPVTVASCESAEK